MSGLTIPGYQSQEKLRPLPGARVHATGDAQDYGASVGASLQELAEFAKAKIYEFENAEVMDTFNQFQKDIDLYHFDPNNGVYNTKKGKNAFNMAETSADDMDKIASKYEKKNMKNPRMVEAFRKMAGRLMNQQLKANMSWESREIDSYLVSNANAIIENGYNRIGEFYDDDNMVEAETYRMDMALVALVENDGIGVYTQKHKEMMSKIAIVQLSHKMQADPIAAQDWFETHKDSILPEIRQKAEATLKARVLSVRGLAVAEEAFSQFNGEYDAARGIQWITQNVDDKELSAAAEGEYTRLIRAKNMGIALAEAETRDRQNKTFEEVQLDYAKGNTKPDAEWLRMEARGDISASHAIWGLSQNEGIANRGKSIEALSKRYRDWNTKTEAEQDVLFMRENNTTNEMHDEAVANLGDLLIGGQLRKNQVKDHQNRGLITRNEERKFLAAIDAMDKVQSTQLSGVKNFFSKVINPSAKDSPLYGRYPSTEYTVKMAEYDNYVIDMMVNQDADIVKKATDKAEEIFNDLLDEVMLQHGITENDYTKTILGFQTPLSRPTNYSEAVKQTREALKTIRTLNSQEKPSLVKPDEINLAAARPLSDIKALSADILGGDYPITSGYTESRDGGTRQHNGYDIAAPKGTPVRVPDIGLRDLKITSLAADRRDATKGTGNYVRFEGVDAAGNVVEFQMNHMDSVSAFGVGDSLTPGGLLGTVGNSGSTYSKSGGDGSHLDLKVKVNGKYVDPAAIPQPAGQTPAAKTRTEVMNMSEEERARYILNGGMIE